MYDSTKQEPTLDHLHEAMRTLCSEQQEISLRAACSTLSLSHLNKRVLLFERVLIALSRKEQDGEPGVVVRGEGEGGVEEEGGEKMDRERVRELEEEM